MGVVEGAVSSTIIINKNNLSIVVQVGLEIVGSIEPTHMNMVKFCLPATGINCRYDNICVISKLE